ncbi:MAG: substrate-binding domain-containing protein [Pseudomonadota bacterium]
MTSKYLIPLFSIVAISVAGCGGTGGSSGGARKEIRVVGSSTVFPFAQIVAEKLSKDGKFTSPVIESTGTGNGIKLFCAGVGATFPDVVNASRRFKKSEYETCASKGIKDIVEIQIGLDGVAFAEANNSELKLKLSPVDVYKAVAANPFGKPNTTKNWSDVNPALPNVPILIYGPASTSGTRDALAELILTKGCDSDPAMKALKDSDKDKHKSICTRVREDSAYVNVTDNYNLIVSKISANPKAIGIFGYEFLEANTDKIRGITMDGVAPTYENIASFSYPGARPLYFYVKSAHLTSIKGLKEFSGGFVENWGPDGLFKQRGLVVAPEDVRAANAKIVEAMTPLDPTTLK